MQSLVITPKSIAHTFAHTLFYLPRGFILPILIRFDTARELIAHHDVACAFCSHKIHTKRDAKSKVARDSQTKLNRLQRKLENIVQRIIHFALFILYKIFPKSWLDALNNKYQQIGKAILPKLKKFADFLLRNQEPIVWYCLLPAMALLGCAWIYGLGIIPEIYALLVASFWGGKILNTIANLIVHQQKSNEWIAIAKVGSKLRGKEENAIAAPTKKEAIKLAKRLIVEITLINIIQKFPQFIGYCFQAFFSWLAFYVIVKTATNEAPMMLHKLEQRMKNSHPAPLHGYHQVDNALWLVSYQAFMMTGSDRALKKYKKLHEGVHHPSDIQRKPSSIRRVK